MSGEFRELARRLRRLEEGVKAQNVPQLAHSSVEDGAIEHYDADGQLTAIVGKQHDDTTAPVIVTGPPPPAPTGLDVVGGQLQVTATWDGTWADGAVAPMDFARVEVHVGASQDFEVDPLPMSTTRVATIESPGGASVTWMAEPGEVWVTIVARSLPGKVSEHRELVMVEVSAAVDPEAFEQLKVDLTESEARVKARMEEIATMPLDATRITDGSIYAPKLDANSLGALVAQILTLDVSHLTASDAKIGDAVAQRMFVDVFAANKVTANELDAASVAAAVGVFVRVKAEQLDSGFLNASIGIGTTGAIMAGDWSKSYARIDDKGFSTWMVAEDGTQYMATSLGSATSNSLAIADATAVTRASITPDGDASFEGLDVDSDPNFMGRPLLGKRVDPDADDGILDDGPRGLVAFGDVRSAVGGVSWASSGGSTLTPLMVVGFTMSPGRTYRVTMPWRADISNVTSGYVARAGIIVHYTWAAGDAANPDEPSTTSTRVNDAMQSYPSPVSGVSGLMTFFWRSPFSSPTTVKLLVSAVTDRCTMTPSNYGANDWRIWVEDAGPWIESTARVLDIASSGQVTPQPSTSNPTPTTPAPPPKRTYTATWAGTASRAWNGDGAQSHWGDTLNAQGILPHGYYPGFGAMRSGVIFNGASVDSEKKTLSAALNGATITKAEVFVKFPHWYYSTGGTAVLHPLGGSSLPDTMPSVNSASVRKAYTARGQGYWVQVPTSWFSSSATGVVIGPGTANNVTSYGYFAGPSYPTTGDRIKLRLTYTR